MTRGQVAGLLVTSAALGAAGYYLMRAPQRPAEKPAAQAKLSSDTPQRVSDTPQRVSDTPQRTSDTPQRVSDTPQRVSDTPQRVSDTPQRTAVLPPVAAKAFSCADARESAARDVVGLRMKGGDFWPVPSGAAAVVFDAELGEPAGFLLPTADGARVLDLWGLEAGKAARSAVPRRPSSGSLPVVAAAALGGDVAAALKRAYPPALRARGKRGSVPSFAGLEKPAFSDGAGSSQPARRGATACVFPGAGKRDVVLSRDGRVESAWTGLDDALYGHVAEILSLTR